MNITVDFERMQLPKIKQVIIKKLKRNAAFGMAFDDGIIHIDPRIKGRKELEILIHEGSHITLPFLDEPTIEHHGAEIARLLWDQGFRKVDNDATQKLQDEIE